MPNVEKTTDLYYQTFGSSQRPLIILHGLFGRARNWQTVAKLLAANYCVYTLDMRNHGASPHTDFISYEAMSDDLLRFMDLHQIPEATILGHSMGGKTAMQFALHHAERVIMLVVVDIAPVAYPHHRPHFEMLIQALMHLPLDHLASRNEAEQWLHAQIGDLKLTQYLLQNLVFERGKYFWRCNLQAIARSLDAILSFPPLPSGLSLTKPVLFVAGEKSNYLHQAYAAEIRRLFPQAVHYKIAQAGHWPHVENPSEFMRVLQDFLTKVNTTSIKC